MLQLDMTSRLITFIPFHNQEHTCSETTDPFSHRRDAYRDTTLGGHEQQRKTFYNSTQLQRFQRQHLIPTAHFHRYRYTVSRHYKSIFLEQRILPSSRLSAAHGLQRPERHWPDKCPASQRRSNRHADDRDNSGNLYGCTQRDCHHSSAAGSFGKSHVEGAQQRRGRRFLPGGSRSFWIDAILHDRHNHRVFHCVYRCFRPGRQNLCLCGPCGRRHRHSQQSFQHHHPGDPIKKVHGKNREHTVVVPSRNTTRCAQPFVRICDTKTS